MSDNIEDVYELSPMQEGILFDYLYNSNTTLYHEQNYYHFKGEVDPGIMKKAIDILAMRHTALRTSIIYEKLNVPYQVVLKDRNIGFSFIDISAENDKKKRESDLNELKEKERQKRFNLTDDVLIKVMVVKVKDGEFVLVWTFHHIIMDAWCIDVLVSEFYTIMSAIELDKPLTLAQPRPYSSFIKYIYSKSKEENLAWWNNYLKDYNESEGFLQPQGQVNNLKNELKSCFVLLGQDNTTTIKDICDIHGFASSTFFRTVWGILLSKYNGSHDAVYGTIVPGRPTEMSGSESIIGLFMNNIPLRVKYEDDTLFFDLLSRIQNQLLDSEKHQFVSLSDIKAGRKKLYDNIFMFQNFPVHERTQSSSGDEREKFVNLQLLQSGFYESVAGDVIVRVSAGSNISLEILYNAAIYDEKFIRFLLLNFKFLLTFSCKKPFAQLSTFFLLTDEETYKVNFEGSYDHYISLGKQRHYWLSRFSGELPALELPTDHDRTQVNTWNGDSVHGVLDAAMTKRLKALAQEQQVSLFNLLLTAVKVLLHRYTGQQDIIVGTVVPYDDQKGSDVNILPIRSHVYGEESIEQLLGRVKNIISDASTHRAYPFDRLANELSLKPENSNRPLFNVMVLPVMPDETHTIKHLNNQRGPELTFSIIEEETQITVYIRYNKDLFVKERIERMLGHYLQLVESIAENAQTLMGKLKMLTGQEERQLLFEFNTADNDPYPYTTLARLFEEQVYKTPDAVALVFEGQQLTYRQLNEQSNQVGHYLRKCGVKEERLVGICMERSLELVIGILGIIKSGGVYVPIDGDYPEERIKYMLEDSNCQWLLSNGKNEKLERINQDLKGSISIIDVKDKADDLRLQPMDDVSNGLRSHHAAYVIYTSGSTGKPKGVIIEHQSVVNRLLWGQEYFKLSAADAVLQKTHYCFDVSVWEFFWPLIVGARLVMAIPNGHKDSFYLRSVIDREQITMVHFVPSMLETFLEEIHQGDCKSLRWVLCVGEPLKNIHRSLFDDRLPNAGLYNLYGPTEAAIEVTCADIIHGSTDLISIGKPVKNTQMHVLDNYGNLVAVGNVGELYIGGVQVGRGYVNRVDLTAEKFVPDPFSKEPGGRLYRTGDLGRWLPDGNIEFLGRIDGQVKIRGYRIELGEIESTLQQIEGIKQCVVVVAEDGKGDKQLVGYIVPNGSFDKEKTVVQLRQQLPEYLIPAVLATTDEIPHTANGKVDRRALPPVNMTDILRTSYVAPRNATEETLCSIWQEVLGVEQVGINDNFFEQGGHSLKVMRVIFRINKVTGIMLDVRELFTFPTIAELADHVKSMQKEQLQSTG
jgi:amino acid adenylation domain-containing protein